MRFSGALIACLALLLARQEAQVRGSAALFGEEYSDMGAAFPAGAAGGADVLADGRLLGARFDPGTPVQEARELVERTLRSECSKAPGGAAAGFSPTAENTDDAAPPANASVACAPTIDGLDAVWAALPAELRPAMSGLARSDAAFARLRLTANPLMLRAVAALPEGWSPAGITGLDEAGIIAGTGLTLEQLLAAGRVFSVDFAPLAPVLLPAPGAHLEIPTALFFLDGNATGAGGTPEGDVSAFDAPSGTLDAGASKDSSSQLQLMPLAIK
ncbi:arachidonate 15-lipoxygenase B-like isoform B [Micractinium conductrix]|nr:arachidonate 15-lipoxygenase B-like isoform B [Micractinium conductrix]|eukprot:PSC76054.1 arachidonate 15-lipoxygenase B-like isoform B [Micractinium conductrix]